MVDFAHGQQFDDEHGAEEPKHFPHADEDVGEVAGRFHLLLNFSQVFDKTCDTQTIK